LRLQITARLRHQIGPATSLKRSAHRATFAIRDVPHFAIDKT
jgi:hypothetical protein